MSEKMPAFPNPRDYGIFVVKIPDGHGRTITSVGTPTKSQRAVYETARADAWEARARMAAGVLEHYSHCPGGANAIEALAAIGPLPEEKT